MAAALLTSGCKGPERTVYRAGNSYFPLLDDRELAYEEQRNGKTRAYTMNMQFAGGQMIKVYAVKFRGADFGDCTLLSRDSMIVWATSKPHFAFEPRGTLPEYRELWVDAAVAPGDHWIDDDTGTRTALEGFETVQVPAGRYERCYKTVTEAIPEYFDSLDVRRQRGDLSASQHEEERELARQVVTRWFAPGVGLVKEQIGSSIVRVLTEIRNEGTGGIDTTRPEKFDMPG